MAYAYKQDGTWIEFTGSPVVNGEHYPANWCDLATPQMRTARGIRLIVEPPAVPAGMRATGSAIVGDETPQRVLATEAIPLAEVKAQRKQEAEAYRDQRIDGGAATTFGIVDSDQNSRLNIVAAVAMANIVGASFTATWRRKDNSYVSLNAVNMASLGLQAGQFATACYTACFAAKDAIDAASTATAVLGVNITAGYPA